MQLGMVGLGRMGANIVRRLMNDGHECVVYDVNADAVTALAGEGATGAESFADMASKLEAPRAIWLMIPAGLTGDVVDQVAEVLEPGDIIIDGGNSNYRDDVRRAAKLKPKGIHYVDAGTSGGVFGLERGYCLMVGGPNEAFDRIEPILKTIAPGKGDIERTPGRTGDYAPEELGYLHCGPSGAGHFVKMVHNGIEYGLMQAYAEGFDVLKGRSSDKLAKDERFNLNLTDIAEVWRRGSVISSWLLDLSAAALAANHTLDTYSGRVADSGEGHWTIEAAMEECVAVHVLSAALFTRFRSRVEGTFGDKLLSAMRFGFGGHVEIPQ